MAEMVIPYPFKDSTNITLRFLRSGEPETNDDLVTVVHQGDDLYHVYFKDGNWNTDTSHMTALTGDELDEYLSNLFFLITRDSQPFRSVQLNIPCMPCIMLDVSDLKKKGIRRSLQTILPILRSCIKVKW
jgi:hypothetical protein